MAERNENRSLGELFSELSQELRTLMKQEMQLFRIEISEKMVQLVKDAVGLGIGGFLLYCGALTFIAALVIILSLAMPLWLSALVVSILFLLVGIVLVTKGTKDLKRMQIKPEKSTETFKETTQWAKSQMKRS